MCVCVCVGGVSLRRLSHVSGLAFLRLLSCDKLKVVLLWTTALTSVGVASVIHSQVNKHTYKHKNNALRRCFKASRHIIAKLNPRENSAETEPQASCEWAVARCCTPPTPPNNKSGSSHVVVMTNAEDRRLHLYEKCLHFTENELAAGSGTFSWKKTHDGQQERDGWEATYKNKVAVLETPEAAGTYELRIL